MKNNTPFKDHNQEVELISRRVIVILVLMTIALTCLVFRLFYLQSVQHHLYTTLSNKNWLDIVPIEPTRGLIYDRNGVLLAENIPVFSLDIVPKDVTNLNQTIYQIGQLIDLSPAEIAQFQKQLKTHRRFDEIPLKLQLSETEVSRFAENQYRFSGAFIKARLIRHYPKSQTFAHVLGYMGRINAQEINHVDPINYSATNYIGKLGVEKMYEHELHGNVGHQKVENDASGQAIRVMDVISSEPGQNIYLTIDSGLQEAAAKALAGQRGAVIAIQPNTGQILALVSVPSYDPNLFVKGINHHDYQQLQKASDKPLYNRVMRGLYPFASTIKPFIALAGLENNIITPATTVYDPGWFQLNNNGHIFHDWRKGGHGMVDITRAIAVSCDIYFYNLANRLGIERIDAILNRFGFGQITGLNPNEESAGLVSSPAWKLRYRHDHWYPGDTLISGIGQGNMQTTPLQLAVATTIIANRGNHYQPSLLLAKQVAGKPLQYIKPIKLNPIMLNNPKHWDVIIQAMQQVVASSEGTATRLGKKPYTIAAKTGTAQVFSKIELDRAGMIARLPVQLHDHSLFIAFAPVIHPKIAVAIIAENTKQAVPIAEQVLDYYLLPNHHLPAPLTKSSPTRPILTNTATMATVQSSSTTKTRGPQARPIAMKQDMPHGPTTISL